MMCERSIAQPITRRSDEPPIVQRGSCWVRYSIGGLNGIFMMMKNNNNLDIGSLARSNFWCGG